MAHAAAAAVPAAFTCCCSVGVPSVRHRSKAFNLPSIHFSPIEKNTVGTKRARQVDPVAVLPLLSLAAEQQQYEYITVYNDWTIDELTLKNIYLGFSLFFCWGCCVFGSMHDPFYDSDVYRDAGGDGSGNWIYRLEEEEEVQAREELWREELAREIEERVGELRELEEAEKKKELV